MEYLLYVHAKNIEQMQTYSLIQFYYRFRESN